MLDENTQKLIRQLVEERLAQRNLASDDYDVENPAYDAAQEEYDKNPHDLLRDKLGAGEDQMLDRVGSPEEGGELEPPMPGLENEGLMKLKALQDMLKKRGY